MTLTLVVIPGQPLGYLFILCTYENTCFFNRDFRVKPFCQIWQALYFSLYLSDMESINITYFDQLK